MEKESVKMFDLQAAFKALDEIEAPKTKGLKANRIDLKERFAAREATTALVEDYYSVNDQEALEEAQEDREAEVAKAKLARIEKIVDLDAETEDDLLPSYVGKVIIQCPQCMTLFYKKPEDIEHSEENPDVVNINEVCQHCGNTSGYTLIGKVDEVKDDEANHFETEENELDLDFGAPTEETSPEGTGGGFEDELELNIEGSEDSEDLDLDIDEVELNLEPTEESLQVNEAVEDSDSEDIDETEVTVTVGEIKDVAEDAGKAVIKAEVEEKEEVKEITDEVVEKEVEVKKETLTEDLENTEKDSLLAQSALNPDSDYQAVETEVTTNPETAEQVDKVLDDATKTFEGCKYGNCKEEICPECGKEINECNKQVVEEKCDNCEKGEECEHCEDKKLTEAPQTPDEIERVLLSVADSFDESLKEEKVSNSEFKKMINSKVWKDFDEGLEEDLETVASKLPEVCDALEHAGEDAAKDVEVEKEVTEESLTEEKVQEAATYTAIPKNLPWWIHPLDADVEEGYKGTPEERTTHLEYTDDDPTDGKAVLPDNIEKQLTEETVEEHVQDRPAPIEDETKYQGVDNQVVPCETTLIVSHSEDEKPLDCKMEKPALEEPVAGEEVEIKVIKEEIEDFNEHFFDESVNKYLKEVYENVNEYKTNNCELKDGKLFVEGTILFNSGRAKKTVFEFLPISQDNGTMILEGYNKDLTEEKAFTVKGLLEGGNQFVTESFGYKYTINNTLVEGLK